MSIKKRIFIGSSSGAKQQARKIAEILEDLGASVTGWWMMESFTTGQYTLDELLKAANNHDGGIFVLAEDDKIVIANKEQFTARDNVLIEAGIFYGALGRAAVGLCIVGNIHMPTDWQGITTIGYDSNAENRMRRKLEIWLQNIVYHFEKKQNNVSMLARKEIHQQYTIDERLQITSGLYKNIRNIRLLNFASTLFLNPNNGDSAHIRQLNSEPINLSQAISLVLKDSDANLELILTKPTPLNLEDIKTKIANPKVGATGAVYSALNSLHQLTSNDTIYKGLLKRPNNRFKYYVTSVSIPFAIFHVEFHDDYSYLNHVKVDLYSAELANEDDRRSMIIWQATDNLNYHFFVDNFDRIRRGTTCEVPSCEDLEKWAQKWEKICNE